MALPSRGPSLGAIALLIVLGVVLVGGGDESDHATREGRAERQEERGENAERGLADRRRPDGDGGAQSGEADTDTPEQGAERGVLVPVVDIVDGDTIEVVLDGVTEDVRYIGVDTPESVAPGQPVECFGERASEFNSRLVVGEQVRLVFDAERRDVYGRLLAYVYAGERFVNAALVRSGHARTLTIAPNDTFARLFARLQQAAGNAGRGLWGACGP